MTTIMVQPLPLVAAAPATGLWSIALPLALGLTAVYLLLPKARRYPPLAGAALGGVALLLAGWLLVRTGTVNAEAVLFYSFSALAIVGGASLITHVNPVHAALSFALVVLSTCGLFLLLAAPFLMAATIIVYAGAIIVTFLFVIMLAQQSGLSNADQRSREPLLSAAAGFVLLGALLYVLHATYDTSELDRLLARVDQVRQEINDVAASPSPAKEKEVREHFENLAHEFQREGERLKALPDGKLLAAEAVNARTEADPHEFRVSLARLRTVAERIRDNPANLSGGASGLSPFSGPPANQEPRREPETGRPEMPAENVAYLGRSLFTDYLLPVELGGTLLLVATIGAIAITGRRGERSP